MTAPVSLFREDVIRFKRHGQQAQVLLKRTSSNKTFVWLLCALAVVLVFAINQIQYKEVESARGHLIGVGGQVQLVAPKDGLVHSILVQPGQTVKEGDRVAQISTQLYDQLGIDTTQREEELLHAELDFLQREKQVQQQLYTQRDASLRARANSLEENIRLSTHGLALLNEQEVISASLIEGTRQLLNREAISQAQASNQQLAHLDLMRERQLAESQLQQFVVAAHETTAELEALDLEQQSKLHRLNKDVRQIALQLDSLKTKPFFSIMANRAGTVSSIPVTLGSAVKEGQPLIYLQPPGQELMAEVYVPSSILGKLAPGQQVMLRYDAFGVHSYGRYAASIKSIDRAALDQRQHLLPVAQATEPLFKVLLSPAQHYVEGEDIYPLQPGLQLSADFVINELSLVQYIFRPLLNLRGRVT